MISKIPPNITQGEGVEQGDPLAPALYALGQRHALEVAAAQLLPDEVLAAYLDDVYIICQPDRARPAFDIGSAGPSKAMPGSPPTQAKLVSSPALEAQRRLALKRSALMCGAVVTAQSVAWSP